jgi:4-cresol dehydrogenase (hydroxylating) flavoprotein subunit
MLGAPDIDGRCPMATALTPHLTAESLALALDAFRSALGPEAVIAGEDELREFRDPFAFATWDDYTASAVLMPETVEEIQQIVGIANEHGIPLWTHATGMNNGYGGPAPRVKGSVVVSLRNAVLIPTNARSFIHVTMVIFDTKNEAEVRRAYDTSRLLVQECAKHGYGE